MEPGLVMTLCVASSQMRFVSQSLHFGICYESQLCSCARQGHPKDPGTQRMVGGASPCPGRHGVSVDGKQL